MNELHRSIEAILMVVDEPVSELTLATILEHPEGDIALRMLKNGRQGQFGDGFIYDHQYCLY